MDTCRTCWFRSRMRTSSSAFPPTGPSETFRSTGIQQRSRDSARASEIDAGNPRLSVADQRLENHGKPLATFHIKARDALTRGRPLDRGWRRLDVRTESLQHLRSRI